MNTPRSSVFDPRFWAWGWLLGTIGALAVGLMVGGAFAVGLMVAGRPGIPTMELIRYPMAMGTVFGALLGWYVYRALYDTRKEVV